MGDIESLLSGQAMMLGLLLFGSAELGSVS
jgi:hypothetical protein